MAKKVRLQINYKSGKSTTVECDRFKVIRTSTGMELEWDNLEPRPLLIGVDYIESIWQL